MGEKTLVKMEGITKTFPGVVALDNVSFELKSGQVHILLGENGAGKSTLMKILGGVYEPDSGHIFIKGNESTINSVRKAQELGISIIFQELNLIPCLTVAENIYLGKQPMKNGRVDWAKMYAQTSDLLNDLGVDLNPKTIVGELTVSLQQMVEVAKAISGDVEILIMDEPTSSLCDQEIKELFKIVRTLQSRGVGIVYISHRMEELKEIGDVISIYRDGKYIETIDISQKLDIDYLIKQMVGRDIREQFPKEKVEIGDEILKVEDVSTKKLLKNCSFSVRRGEILGFAGLVGAGRTELMRAITGADSRAGGRIYFEGKEVLINSVKDSVRLGFGFLTEDRKGQGLILGMNIKENITLVGINKILDAGNLNLRKETRVAEKLVENLRIKIASLNEQVLNLSGGNQQKVVLAKWLFAECKVMIFDEPTRGIDVGAKVEIYKLMAELAKSGVAIIMVSSELPEILGICDRIVVMREGEITGSIDAKEANQENIMAYATGGYQ